MKLEVDVIGLDKVEAHLTTFRERLDQPQPVFKNDIASYFRAIERRRFETEGDGQWPALNPNTIRKKGSSRPMVDSGGLLASLTVPRARGAVTRATRTTLTFGTRLFYAKFVTKRRPLFNTTEQDARIVAKRIVDWLLEPFDR